MTTKLFLKHILPKRMVTKYRISKMLGYKINLESPKTFNEKIQWLKLNYKRKDLSIYADKVEVRNYVANKIGKNYLIPIHKIFATYKDINLSNLPDNFALKAAHGSKWNVICQNKSQINESQFYHDIKEWGNSNYYWLGYEYAYKHIPPRFICEKIILDHNNEIPKDFKIFCFNGIARYIQIDTNRFSKHQRLFYDLQWNKQSFELGFEMHNANISRPDTLDEMIHIAEKLSANLPFVRIDLYDCKGKVYFGEMTFYPGEGSECFKPQKWDKIFGDFLTLPK